jgi:SAM-dependent methyltransferase
VATIPYSTVISPNDHMWATGQSWYFEVGLSALECVNRALTDAGVTPRAILDMPCGHGRVCRMLRAAFPSAHITVCDLDPDGVDFCAHEFHAEPLYSHEDVRAVKLDRVFDLIWCGSLFTHLDRDRWPPFLEFFADHLAPDGVLVFTTHGRRPIQWMLGGVFSYGLTLDEQRSLVEHYARDGFGFVSPANQAFGISLSSMSFVCAQVERQPSLKLVGLREAAWAGHHDVASCAKLPVPFPAAVFKAPAASTDRPAPQPDKERPMGHIDSPPRHISAVGPLSVSGWAGDERGIREVRVLLDGRIVAVTAVTIERPDVSAVFPTFRHGHDRHGWSAILQLEEPGPHSMSVQAENVDGITADLGVRIITVPPHREG